MIKLEWKISSLLDVNWDDFQKHRENCPFEIDLNMIFHKHFHSNIS